MPDEPGRDPLAPPTLGAAPTARAIPLGTSAAIPAHGRHLSATALAWGPRLLLFDCGEATQFRLAAAGLSALRVDAVFVTHLHGDHFFGLPGLLSTMAMQGRTAPLVLVGPEGLWRILDAIPSIGLSQPPFEIRYTSWPVEGARAAFGKATVYEDDRLTVVARPIEHRVPCAGYRVEERPRPGNLDVAKARARGLTDWHDYRRLKAGEAVTAPDGSRVLPEDVVAPGPAPRSFAYVLDSRPCEGGRLLARGASLLIHDATFEEAFAARAVETGHSTAREAAEVARDAGAGRLLLTHFSARHADVVTLVEEARAIYPPTDAAVELAPVAIPEGV